MSKSVSARRANQEFSKILRAVENGEEFIVTRRGSPVARILPILTDGRRQLTPGQEEILARTMARLRRGWNLGGARLDRESLYDR